MSWWPFVSRLRFEDMEGRCQRLEREREVLLDRIAVMSGQAPLYRENQAVIAARQAVMPVPVRSAADSRRRGRLTLADVKALGNEAAKMKAHPEAMAVGAASVVAELNAAAAAGVRQAEGGGHGN